MTRATYDYEIAEFIPGELAEGVLYVSFEYATTAHLCMCGCREKVVAPLTPKDWQVTFDGKAMSLRPSVGNWSLPCESHYFLRKGRVEWAGKWSREKIEAGRVLDDWREGGGEDPANVLPLRRAKESRRLRGRLRRLGRGS